MAKKKVTKKRTVKRKPAKKKVVRKPVKRKPARKAPVKRKPVVKKPVKTDIMKRLEAEVRKPSLGEQKGGDKKFIPEKKPFVKKPFVKRPFVKKPFVRKPFVKRPFNKPFVKKLDLKSHGERQIAQFLREERIHFVYEYPLAITDEDRKVRIWYPDFWLPELNIIIEYMGMKGKGDYDKANTRKKKIYNALKIDFMEITPGLLVKGNWKRFIAMKIMYILKSKQHLLNKMKSLASKYKIPAESREVGLEILD